MAASTPTTADHRDHDRDGDADGHHAGQRPRPDLDPVLIHDVVTA
jgi:hypothetical protein